MKIRKLGWISRGMYLRMMKEAGGQYGDEERMLKKNEVCNFYLQAIHRI
jgi:hypothetical protein